MARNPMVVRSRRSFLIAAGAGTAGFAGGVLAPVGRAVADDPSDVDVGFCTDMATHHVQALVLCQRVLGRDTGDPVQAAASEVLQNQAIEVGMMRAWLADWGESTSSPETVMAWMGAVDGLGIPLAEMPGLATDAQLRELSLASGVDQGRMWLDLMRAHHVGVVAMAEHATMHASSDKAIRLARQQASTQTYEISQYDALLAGDYA